MADATLRLSVRTRNEAVAESFFAHLRGRTASWRSRACILAAITKSTSVYLSKKKRPSASPGSALSSNVHIAAATQSLRLPALTLDAEFPEQDAYEVLILDLERDRRLVAAVEIVSPANEDRPERRRLFLANCLNLLRQDVCPSIVDLVTIRQFNFYIELLARLARCHPAFSPPVPSIYTVTCRKRKVGRQTKLDTWSHPPAVGQPLPALPVWLSETQTESLDLEASYEETSRVLRVS
jgi:hypothetical protein